jgi:hypothetical protein
MADFARHAPLFDQTLAARGYTAVTRRSYLGAVERFDRFVGDVPLDAVLPEQLMEYPAPSRFPRFVLGDVQPERVRPALPEDESRRVGGRGHAVVRRRPTTAPVRP